MLRTGDPGLIRRAAGWIDPELSRPFARDEEGLYRRLELLDIAREALSAEAQAFASAELQDAARMLRERVAAAESEIDRLNDSVPADDYQTATYLQPKIAARIPAALWGPTVDGLRLALVPREWTPGMDWNELPSDLVFPTSITVRPGRELRYQLVVENVSQGEIKLSGIFSGEEEQRSLNLVDQQGQRVATGMLHTTIPHFRSFWRLKPGERMLISMMPLSFVRLDAERTTAPDG
jgi:hypothetical protein